MADDGRVFDRIVHGNRVFWSFPHPADQASFFMNEAGNVFNLCKSRGGGHVTNRLYCAFGEVNFDGRGILARQGGPICKSTPDNPCEEVVDGPPRRDCEWMRSEVLLGVFEEGRDRYNCFIAHIS